MKVRSAIFRLVYEGKNITEDLRPYLINITYNDVEEGESDELSFTVENANLVWLNEWYPAKGDKVQLSIGYDEEALMDCGSFVVDEIQASGPPHTVSIRALAAATNSPLRTKKSKAFEQQTLKQIADKVAADHGYTVQGEIPNITIQRVTQNRETDLAFLKRVSDQYGLVFSIRDQKLIFTNVYELDGGSPVLSLDITELKSYTYTDKTIATFKKAQASYHNPKTNEVVKTIYTDSTERGEGEGDLADDTLEIRTKAENPQQAEAQAKSALHKANTAEAELSATTIGNPLIVAGNNITITGLGKLAGTQHITRSSHTIDRSGGYTTTFDSKRVQRPTNAQKAPKKGASQQQQKQTKFIYTN